MNRRGSSGRRCGRDSSCCICSPSTPTLMCDRPEARPSFEAGGPGPGGSLTLAAGVPVVSSGGQLGRAALLLSEGDQHPDEARGLRHRLNGAELGAT
jgi:hypothetical protein